MGRHEFEFLIGHHLLRSQKCILADNNRKTQNDRKQIEEDVINISGWHSWMMPALKRISFLDTLV